MLTCRREVVQARKYSEANQAPPSMHKHRLGPQFGRPVQFSTVQANETKAFARSVDDHNRWNRVFLLLICVCVCVCVALFFPINIEYNIIIIIRPN